MKPDDRDPSFDVADLVAVQSAGGSAAPDRRRTTPGGRARGRRRPVLVLAALGCLVAAVLAVVLPGSQPADPPPTVRASLATPPRLAASIGFEQLEPAFDAVDARITPVRSTGDATILISGMQGEQISPGDPVAAAVSSRAPSWRFDVGATPTARSPEGATWELSSRGYRVVDATGLRPSWRFDLAVSDSVPPAVGDGLVARLRAEGGRVTLVLLDARDGVLQTELPLSGSWPEFVVIDHGLVVAASSELGEGCRVAAVDTSTGAMAWEALIAGECGSAGTDPPVAQASDEVVILNSQALTILERQGGEVLTTLPGVRGLLVSGSAVVASSAWGGASSRRGGADQGEGLYDGETLRVAMPGILDAVALPGPQPAVALLTEGGGEAAVDAASGEGGTTLRALDVRSGRTIWSHEATALLGVAGDLVFSRGDEAVVARDAATGIERWTIPDPGVAGVLGDDGATALLWGYRDAWGETSIELVAVDLASGQQIWEQSVPEAARVILGPDGRGIVIVTSAGLERWDFATP